MQRFYTFLVAVMLTVAGFAQKTVTFKYEHPDHIASIGGYWESYTIAEDGTCTIPDGTWSFQIRATAKAKITDVIVDEVSKFTSEVPVSSVSISYADIEDGSVIEIITEANPVTIIRIIGNPEHIYLTKDYMRFEDVENVDGEWVIEDQEVGSYGVKVNEGYQIMDVECNIPEERGSVSSDSWSMPWNWKPGEEHVYTITTKSLEELRTEKMTVNVSGDPSKVTLYRYGTYSNPVQLVEGENTVMFQESESPFRIEPEYGCALYSVKLDGTTIEPSGYYGNEYHIEAVNGSVVDVETEFPDIDIPFKFTFLNEGTEGTIAYFRINNNENLNPEVYLAEGFTVKNGTNIFVSFNSGDYDIESITLNGEVLTNYYSQTFFATNPEGYEFVIDATAKPSYQVKVNCEAWEHVKYAVGYTADFYPLESESCVIIVPPSVYSVTFYGFDDYNVTDIVDENGLGVTSTWAPKQVNFYSVTPDDEIEVTINTTYTDRSLAATFYLQPVSDEDKDADKQWWNTEIRLNYKDTNAYKDIVLNEGYNTVKFADSDNPISIAVSPQPSFVYLNGEQLEPENEYSTAPSSIEIEDGDIVKIMYYDEIPEYNVVYAIDENADVKIFHDQVIEIAEPNTHKLMEGTEIHLIFNEIPETEAYYYEHELKINGETVEFEDGEHVLSVMADTNIEVKVNQFTGVENITTGANVPSDVYNLQGVRILNNATAEQIKALPAGIYVIGGEKKAVR